MPVQTVDKVSNGDAVCSLFFYNGIGKSFLLENLAKKLMKRRQSNGGLAKFI